MKHVLLSTMLWLMMSVTTMAEESRTLFIQGGMFCDTEVEVQTLLTGISLANGTFPEEVPEGCGRFAPRQPIPMEVTPMYEYETPMATSVIARFVFVPNGWTQYGWIAYDLNPDYQPASVDPEA